MSLPLFDKESVGIPHGKQKPEEKTKWLLIWK